MITMIDQPNCQENQQNLRSLQNLFATHRVPASGSINLTHRCNLNCVHCYLGGRNSILRASEAELDTQKWTSIIDQITQAGCLHLLLSGGEVLLRPDFDIIYQKAVTNGLLVTVFTNGTLLNDTILALFSDLPPQSVEISLYGASRQTYESITGVKGSFKNCVNGIQQLHERKIRFKLKTMILTLNYSELEKIEKFAKEYGVDFRMDPAVSPCLDSDKSPLNYRVNPDKAVKADFANTDRAKRWTAYYNDRSSSPITPERLYNCGAGFINFHIDPKGILVPCLMLKKPAYNLTSGCFSDGWQNEIAKLQTIKASDNFKCNQCDKKILCSCCPALSALENNSPEIHSQYLCELTEFRQKAISENLAVEGSVHT